ncbi:hypothetical protein COU89_00820 [Candidatus Roizmanbacteria bacterium CG10_big_fil_rev_8_21_14_0_10_45_7]|uniref:Uncharacterized protein n=1 Tax=Candidatus Roizmanbacteria bacterium CG10_big_fil_rev_8_21_14_0_10_45_7 TaxID=1974854 RepID=A0A2M8KVH0_9BACT|nr:MAG: hypothetical protein COU89_00820 [Candidatus Roizmanbacteria bacterium CG10_big_fil_rev_8_21_14_0_10_45_7]
MGNPEYIKEIPRQQEYLGTLTTVRDTYEVAGLNPLFVGGALAKPFNLGMMDQVGVDYGTRTVHVPTTAPHYTALRSNGTYDDMDIIVNHPDKAYVDAVVKETETRLKQEGYTHHIVSTEAVRYPHWQPRSRLRQMVSGIDIDDSGQTQFCFGSTTSPCINPESMQPWIYSMEENGEEIVRLPSFGPAYFGLRYLMRLPVAGAGGLRRKDRASKIDTETGRVTNKIHTLMLLRRRAKEAACDQGYVLDDLAWRRFIIDLQHEKHQDWLTHLKSEVLAWYWQTDFSTAAAHGKNGLEGLAKLGNKFGG